MNYRLIENNVKEIATEEEIEKLELDLARLKTSYFKFPLSLREFFDLYVFNKIIEEKLKSLMFDLSVAKDLEHSVSNKQISDCKKKIASQMVINLNIKNAFQKNLDEQGIIYNVDFEVNDLLKCLKKLKGYKRKMSKNYSVVEERVNAIISKVNSKFGSQPGEQE